MTTSQALLFLVVVVIGYTVSGTVGFGANVLMMPILSMVFPIGDLVRIFALLSFTNALYRVIETRRGILWKPFLRMVIVSVTGAALGLWVFRTLPELWLKLVLGVFVVFMAIYNLATHKKEVKAGTHHGESKLSKIFYQLVLLTGGFFQGAFVCGGPMYVIYCNRYYGENRLHFRSMQFGIIFINSTIVMVTNLMNGAYTADLILPSVFGLGALLGAFYLSAVLMKHLKDTAFYLMVQVVLLLSGLSLVGQSALKLFI